MTADANLVDARTGAIIIANPDLRAFFMAGQGIVGTAVQAAIDNASTQSVVEKRPLWRELSRLAAAQNVSYPVGDG